MKTRRLFAIAAVAIGFVTASMGQNLMSQFTDASGNQDPTNVTLTNDRVWELDVTYYVGAGKTITIQPGTIIKAWESGGANAAALIIQRDAKIYARGTADQPIIFTTILDPIDPVTFESTYSVLNKEKWGGIILLGKAPNNVELGDENFETTISASPANGLFYIEGLVSPDDRILYGADAWANDDPADTPLFVEDDNSGVMTYVSIRHGGSEIGVSNEINGLTLGSVGRGTTLEHIEIVSNGDDGIEFFGGNVDIKYASILFCEDDYIDWDQGYVGRGQFIVGVQLPATDIQATVEGTVQTVTVLNGNRGMECDGNDSPIDPANSSWAVLSNPTFYNITMVGNQTDDDGDDAWRFRANTYGEVANSIWANFSGGPDFDNDDAVLKNNMYIDCGAGEGTPPTAEVGKQTVSGGSVIDYAFSLTTSGLLEDPTHTANGADGFDLIPDPADATNYAIVIDAADTPVDDFFEYAPYRGAFDPNSNAWNDGWSKIEDTKLDDNTVNCPTDTDGDGDTDVNDYNNVVLQFDEDCKL